MDTSEIPMEADLSNCKAVSLEGFRVLLLEERAPNGRTVWVACCVDQNVVAQSYNNSDDALFQLQKTLAAEDLLNGIENIGDAFPDTIALFEAAVNHPMVPPPPLELTVGGIPYKIEVAEVRLG